MRVWALSCMMTTWQLVNFAVFFQLFLIWSIYVFIRKDEMWKYTIIQWITDTFFHVRSSSAMENTATSTRTKSRTIILKFTPCSIYCDKRKLLTWFPSLRYIQTYTTRMGTKYTAQQQWPIWLILSGSREQKRSFFSSFFLCYENRGWLY